MRRYGLYDATRGLMTALAVGVAGLLLWVATQVGMQSTARFWESMGIVAVAGLVLALLPAMGGWTSGLRFRASPGTFLLGFLPALVLVGWVLMATQPGHGWHDAFLEVRPQLSEVADEENGLPRGVLREDREDETV